MRKAFAIILACVLLLGLAACRRQQAIQLYLPNENADGFVVKAAQTDGTIESVVALLVAEGALPEGCAALSFSAQDAALDMNEAFRLAVSTTGTTGEYLRFGSLVNTVLGCYGLEVLHLTAEGLIIETGHEIYDYALRFYDNQGAA